MPTDPPAASHPPAGTELPWAADAAGAAVGPEELLDALGGHTGEMARRAYDIFAAALPGAAGWSLCEQAEFVAQARSRFEAILAVAGHGAEVDPAFVDELHEVGANAARTGAPLPELLVILRISRDLVVQTAVQLASERANAALALSLLLTRILPAMDRLTDALAQGYWAAVLGREDESLARYSHVVQHASDGVYEADLDGRITLANPAFALTVGRRRAEIEGADLVEALRPLDPERTVAALLAGGAELNRHHTVAVRRPDGVRRLLSIETLTRRVHGEVAGYQGIVRDETAAADWDDDRRAFTELVSGELQRPLAAVVGLGAMLESHAGELSAEATERAGKSIRMQAERIGRLADDLYDVGQLRGRTLRVILRPVELLPVVEAALASVRPGPPVAVAVEDGVTVLADPRRLEQSIANLVDNARTHGAEPVHVEAEQTADEVVVRVIDHGAGLAEAEAAELFEGLRRRRPGEGGGRGLLLVRGLVEAMGGRVWYENGGEKGSRFCLAVAAPARGV